LPKGKKKTGYRGSARLEGKIAENTQAKVAGSLSGICQGAGKDSKENVTPTTEIEKKNGGTGATAGHFMDKHTYKGGGRKN